MSSALLAALFAILGLGLIVTSTACGVLWRKVDALESRPSKASNDLARMVEDLVARQEASEARLARLEAPSTASAPHPAGPRGARRVDSGASATSNGPTLISVPDLASPPSTASTSEAAAGLDRRFGPVWAMADEGMSVGEIARESGYPIGQVELILGLRRRRVGTGLEVGPDA